MSTQTHDDVDELDVPTKVDTRAEIEVPAHVWEIAEQRHQQSDTSSTFEEYLLDHLLIDYQFTKTD